ncbi:HAD-IC family P-type ATPase [Spiroplasma platyhelix]|uniref:HAD-IC family P-type ATPase n=1 Tax=Spiroplasma platyhelix PALS-1 TaxID=1276218 RepID=A0A846UCS7_9MOLU|nr:HAD-IC family P-type ATPase [Spiroplasma platyhelix]MBE4703945.1 Magnesium-transporting ATPase, P-type 1 [Spiroplasma platyhelix PALS-1]NKE38318.1 HAD-IC family P-type ATPase [Spiroplasma platyhelix PALS-1]UJB29203.1 Mg(2+) transport ATPase, P-type [Spiroplasma platyhelix PALS-1]
MKKRKIKDDSFKYSEANKVKKLANSSLQSLSKNLNSKIGIKNERREQQVKKFGTNQMSVKKFNYFKKFFEVLVEPFNLLLWVVALTEFFIYLFNGQRAIDLVSSLVVLFMIILAGCVDYIQELKAYQLNDKLRVLVSDNFFILNQEIEDISTFNFIEASKSLIQINQNNLVVGDVISLKHGDLVPADARIIWQNNLLVDQSTLTGESDPVEKIVSNKKKKIVEYQNILFAQTIITSGKCYAVIINTGDKNYSQSILTMAEQIETQSDFTEGINKITKLLVISILVIIPFIFVASGLRTTNWLEALIFTLSIVVSLTPETLPAVISSNLKIGSKKLVKEHVIVKNIDVIQNMGSVNILCTDKTGTLTVDEIEVTDVVDINGKTSECVAKCAYINAFFERNLTNKIDEAIYKKFSHQFDAHSIKLINEVQFDHETKISSVLIKEGNVSKQITKGSVTEMLNIISKVVIDDQIFALDENFKSKINKLISNLNTKGFRVIIVASKQTSEIVHNDLIFEGIISFEDKLKPDIKDVLKVIYESGIDLKILTGDSLEVSQIIAKKLVMRQEESLIGQNLALNNQTKLYQQLIAANIFAKLSPFEKVKIIETLKTNNVVAFLGDGVNDAGALKLADVGISVNTGTPIAKYAADVILLKKDLDVLEQAFIKGRKIFYNALKYIKLTVASNFGLILTLLIGSIWFDFAAMAPIHLLMQNLTFDLANLLFVIDRVDDQAIKKPLKWNIKSIFPFVLVNSILMSIISITNFLVIGYGFDFFNLINQGTKRDLYVTQFQTMFFIESMISHIFFIFFARTARVSIIESRPSFVFFFGMLSFLLVPFLFTFISPIANVFDLAKPPLLWLAVLPGLIALNWILVESAKAIMVKKLNIWI